MDVLESLKNLSGSDRARLIVELLLTDSHNQNGSDNPLNSIQRLLADKSPEKKSPSPKKKQKTLDQWLIKRNDTSKKQEVQPLGHQATTSDNDKVSESEKNSEEINTTDITSDDFRNCNDNSTVPSPSRPVEKSSINTDPSPCVPRQCETNNLSSKKCAPRSKRKVSQPSPSSDCVKPPKRVKKASDDQDHLHVKNDEEIRSVKLTDPISTDESENIIQNNISGGGNLNTKKNKYNLRTKAKNSKLVQQVDKASHNKLTTDKTQTDIIINHIDHRSNDTGSEPKYEAFCKLQKLCKEMSINVLEILKNKNVESVLKDPKVLSNDAIVLLGSLKLNTGETSPIVHLAKSKKKLLELLISNQIKLSPT